MKKENKKEEEYTDEDEEKENFSDKLDIYKYIADIKLRLRRDITADFVLAKLVDKDKTGIIEMTSNAYFAKKLVDVIAIRGRKWKWDKLEKEYKKYKMNENEKKYIKAIGKAIFDIYMTRIYLTVVLNRNVDKNYLINVLSGYGEKEEPQQEEEITKEEGFKLRNLFKRDKEEK